MIRSFENLRPRDVQKLHVKDLCPGIPPEEAIRWDEYIDVARRVVARPKKLVQLGDFIGVRFVLSVQPDLDSDRRKDGGQITFIPMEGKIIYEPEPDKGDQESVTLNEVESVRRDMANLIIAGKIDGQNRRLSIGNNSFRVF